MSDDLRVNRPQQPMTPRMEPQQQMEMERSSNSKAPWIILGVIVIVLIVLGVLFRDKLSGGKMAATTTTTSGSSGYQAVFLTNGQVYFGKLTNADGDYPVLTEIYYLQVVQPPLQGQQTPVAGQPAPAAAPAQPQISLVKLGSELHGPVDQMHIAKTQMLFYEDMKTDSQVVKAIQAYKANPAGGAVPAK